MKRSGHSKPVLDVSWTTPHHFINKNYIIAIAFIRNLVPRVHVPFVQHQDSELWNNQFPETKILGLVVSRRMRGLVYMVSRDKVEVDTFDKGIKYALQKLGTSKFGFERSTVLNFKSKRHKGSGNELVDYSRAPCLGADQKACGLWERDCFICHIAKVNSTSSSTVLCSVVKHAGSGRARKKCRGKHETQS